jgi:hypothetical protein
MKSELTLLTAVLCGFTLTTNAQERVVAEQSAAASSDTDLAKQLANPVANLISVPLQNNIDFGIGPNDATRYTLNIQPVVPFTLNEDWNLITRTIVPVINAESPAPGVPSAFGLGDGPEWGLRLNVVFLFPKYSLFNSPRHRYAQIHEIPIDPPRRPRRRW